jgi:hypothetical protein
MLALGTEAQPINKSIKITQHNMNTLRRYYKLDLIENDIVDSLKRNHTRCKYFSNQYMVNIKVLPLNMF